MHNTYLKVASNLLDCEPVNVHQLEYLLWNSIWTRFI